MIAKSHIAIPKRDNSTPEPKSPLENPLEKEKEIESEKVTSQ